MHNDPSALSCSLAFLRGWGYRAVKKLFWTTSIGMCSESTVTAKDGSSVLEYHLTEVSVMYAGSGVRESLRRSMCLRAMCWVLCSRDLRTCPDGAVFLFFSASNWWFHDGHQILTKFASDLERRLAAGYYSVISWRPLKNMRGWPKYLKRHLSTILCALKHMINREMTNGGWGMIHLMIQIHLSCTNWKDMSWPRNEKQCLFTL